MKTSLCLRFSYIRQFDTMWLKGLLKKLFFNSKNTQTQQKITTCFSDNPNLGGGYFCTPCWFSIDNF